MSDVYSMKAMAMNLHRYFPPGAKCILSTRTRSSSAPTTDSEPSFTMLREKADSGAGGSARVGPRFHTAAKVRRTSYAFTLRLSAASLTSLDFATAVLMAAIFNDGSE